MAENRKCLIGFGRSLTESRFEHCGEEKICTLPKIEPRLSCCADRNVITVVADISPLPEEVTGRRSVLHKEEERMDFYFDRLSVSAFEKASCCVDFLRICSVHEL